MSKANTKNDKKTAPAKPKLTRLTVRSNVKAGRAGCQPCHPPQ